MRKMFRSVLAALTLALIAACTQKEAPPPSIGALATKAFEEYFGPAPTTDKGSCFAFVIYFPSAKAPGKAVPFPFFSFDQASLKRVAVQRLVAGMADVKSYQGEILQPFPQGARLLELSEKEGVATANFSREILRTTPDEAQERALANALVLTLKQFSDIKTVRIRVEGKESRLDKLVESSGEHAVLQPSAPRLLSVTAMRDKGARDVEEVDAFFDRPVEIKMLQISGADGKPFQGEIYHSALDMAAVLKPKDPSAFKPGMPVKVRWQVVDKKGRAADGDSELMLEVKEH